MGEPSKGFVFRVLQMWLGLALATSLLFVCEAPDLQASVSVAISPVDTTVSPGAEFEVELRVTDVGNAFNGFEAIVSYDPSALTLIPLSPVSQQRGVLMTSACSNTFHRFRQGAGQDTISLVLLCNDVSVQGPGQVYRLRFQASSTSQTASIQFFQIPDFFDAGVAVFPVVSSGATIHIGSLVDVTPGFRGDPFLRAAPNPARGRTRLQLQVREAGQYELAVYDVAGRVIRHLHSGFLSEGPSEFSWDGRREDGSGVASGVYFANLAGMGIRIRVPILQLR